MNSTITSGGIIGREMLWGLAFGTPLGAIYGLVVTGFGSWASVGFVVGLLTGAIAGVVLGLLIGAALAVMHARFTRRQITDPGSYRLAGNLVCFGVIAAAFIVVTLIWGGYSLFYYAGVEMMALIILLGAAFLGTNLVLKWMIKVLGSAWAGTGQVQGAGALEEKAPALWGNLQPAAVWTGWTLRVTLFGVAAWVIMSSIIWVVGGVAPYGLSLVFALALLLVTAIAIGKAQENALRRNMRVHNWLVTIIGPATLILVVSSVLPMIGWYGWYAFSSSSLVGAVFGALAGVLAGWLQKPRLDRALASNTGIAWPLANGVGMAVAWVVGGLTSDLVGAMIMSQSSYSYSYSYLWFFVISTAMAGMGIFIFGAVTGLGLVRILNTAGQRIGEVAGEPQFAAPPIPAPDLPVHAAPGAIATPKPVMPSIAPEAARTIRVRRKHKAITGTSG